MTYDPDQAISGQPGGSSQLSRGGVAIEPTGPAAGQQYRSGTPEPGRRRTALIGAGLAVLVLLGGLITGLVVSYNSGPAPYRTIAAVAGTGINVSPPFSIKSGSVIARYSYSCTGTSGSRAFAAGLVAATPGNDQKIAFTSGGTHTISVTLHPKPGTYRLGGDSACPYKVSILSR